MLPYMESRYLSIMEGCCWGCGAALVLGFVPGCLVGAVVAFVLLLGVWVWAAMKEYRHGEG